MAMCVCAECKAPVSDRAAACPQCGMVFRKRPSGCALIAVVGIGGGILLGAILDAQQGDPPPPPSAPSQVAAMSEDQRRNLLGGVLTRADEPCTANRTFLQGNLDGNAYWNVGCTNGKAYVVQIDGDKVGSTGIVDCALLKMVNARACFTKF